MKSAGALAVHLQRGSNLRQTETFDRAFLPGLALFVNRDTAIFNRTVEACPGDTQSTDSLARADHWLLLHVPTVTDVPIVPNVPTWYTWNNWYRRLKAMTHRVVNEDTTWRGWQLPPGVKAYVFARDGMTCRYCGASGPDVILEPDHVIPVRLFGPNACKNITTACRPCNRDKGGHTVECWRGGKLCTLTIPFPRYSKTACTIGGTP